MTTIQDREVKPLTKRQQELFVKYYPVVKKVVQTMRSKLPSYADLDELHSAGVAGLADAVRRLNPEMEKSFDGYVAMRVRGAVIDELRDLDYMSRSARSDAKRVDKIRDELEQKFGRRPSESEVRGQLGVSRKQFDKINRRIGTYSFVSLNDTAQKNESDAPSIAESVADENAKTAVETIEKRELSESVRSNIAALPERQRRVLESYYFQEKKLGEIARDFGLTEARICQIHSQALKNLRPSFVN